MEASISILHENMRTQVVIFSSEELGTNLQRDYLGNKVSMGDQFSYQLFFSLKY